MSASRLVWAVALGALLVVVAGMIPLSGIIAAHSTPVSPSSSTHGTWNWSNSSAVYAVSFTETGLPNGTNWTVQVSGHWGWASPGRSLSVVAAPGWHHGRTNTSSGSTIGFELSNGSYRYTVLPVSSGATTYGPNPSSGELLVNGSAVSVAVTFSAIPQYTLSFSESGLPTGTFWSVALEGSQPWSGPFAVSPRSPECYGGLQNGSNSSTVNFLLQDGNYSFSIGNVSNGSQLYVPSPGTGNVLVNGSNVTVTVTFSRLAFYDIVFAETGLPNGTNWSVQLTNGSAGWFWTGSTFWNGSTNRTINFTVPNGTYDFAVGSVGVGAANYMPTPANGTVTVNGSAVTVDITFAPLALYEVSFVETGLPSGTNWSVQLFDWTVGWFWNGSAHSTINFTVPNGTYNFSVRSGGWGGSLYTPTPASGVVSVNGSNVEVAITFTSIVLYNVTFVETGLPNGTQWFVALFGGGPGWSFEQSNTTSLSFNLTNGTYGFSVGAAWAAGTAYLPTPSYGTETVAGSNVTVDVSFGAAP